MEETAQTYPNARMQLNGDAPLQRLEDDEFGLAQVADGLASALAMRISADGYTLGIEGDWGSGKSTLVNFVAEKLRDCNEHVIIRFEPWLIGEKNALVAAFFAQFALEIDKIERKQYRWWHLNRWRFVRRIRTLSDKVRRYGDHMGALAAPISSTLIADPSGTMTVAATSLKTASIFSKLLKPPSLDLLRSEIVSGLRGLSKSSQGLRFTVIIDDTDRLEASEAMELLRLVRKVADFPLVTYLICFDAGILAQQVTHALGLQEGRRYTEKIFQDVIHVPPQEPFALRRYLKRLLRESFPREMAGSLDNHDAQFREEVLFDRCVVTW